MSDKHYHIEVYQDIILVTLRGQWDMGINIQYLADFSDTLKARRGKAFHILVDMRSWSVPNTALFARIKAPIQIDRRNQRSEIWLENNTTSADHIADKFFNEQHFQLHRKKGETAFFAQINAVFCENIQAHIKDWVARYPVD